MEIKIDLVTSANACEYQKLFDTSHQEEESLWYMNDGYYTPDESKSSWNTAKYIVWECNQNGNREKAVGYFTITKYHQHLRAMINGLYLLPDYRKKGIPKHIILFIGDKIFVESGYNSIAVSAWSSNERIIKLYDYIMRRTGEQKEFYYYNRKYHSKITWGVTYSDSIWKTDKKVELEDIEEKIK